MKAELYSLDLSPQGTLSIMAHPRGGDWLSDEMQALATAHVNVVVSLLTVAEQWELDLTDEQRLCQACGLAYYWLPIEDMSTPPVNDETIRLIQNLAGMLTEGSHIAIHCRMGIGRSSLLAASILVMLGQSAQDAFAAITTARGRPVPETITQRRWVEDLAKTMLH